MFSECYPGNSHGSISTSTTTYHRIDTDSVLQYVLHHGIACQPSHLNDCHLGLDTFKYLHGKAFIRALTPVSSWDTKRYDQIQ